MPRRGIVTRKETLPDPVYGQVPAIAGGDRGICTDDLLESIKQ